MLLLKIINKESIMRLMLERVAGNFHVTPVSCVDEVVVESRDATSCTFRNSVTGTGIILKKVNVNELFLIHPDISAFGNCSKDDMQCQDITDEDVTRANAGLEFPILSIEEPSVTIPEGMSKSLLKKYFTFCRVFGFFELVPSDITLQEFDGFIRVTVNENVPLYTGTLEIKTW